MSEENIRGHFVWHELMTTDPGAAKAFYTAIVGWKTKEWEGGDQPYTLWMWGESRMGGLMKLPDEGMPPHWLAYIGTPDVDATTARAKELGGKVMMEPTDIPTIGRFSILQDPYGATFAAFTPLPTQSPQPAAEPGLGDFSWHELTTKDYNAAFDFYSDLFGWEKTSAMDMGPAGVYQMFGQNGVPYGGIYNQMPEMQGPPAWLNYICVKDVHPLTEKIKEHGGQVINGPMEVPGGDWITMGIDPQGAPFAIHHRAAKAQS
jgi:uncharacterized protein